jgi:hypothetical protein
LHHICLIGPTITLDEKHLPHGQDKVNCRSFDAGR